MLARRKSYIPSKINVFDMKKKLGKIHFMLTGGTIDSYYSTKDDTAIP